jgi:alpha-L-fucosidase
MPLRAQLEGERSSTSSAHPVAAVQDTETPAARDALLRWWRDALRNVHSLGTLLHPREQLQRGKGWRCWGVDHEHRLLPVGDYRSLANRFNPIAFNAHYIVALAKDAGMKYIVITAKHHDGFAMFDSKADPFNIVARTPFHRDPIRELAVECKKQGIKLGFYYSKDQDWTAPGGPRLRRATTSLPHSTGIMRRTETLPHICIARLSHS